MTQRNSEKVKKFHVLSAGCSPSSDDASPYICFFFSCKSLPFLVLKTLDPDPDPEHNPDPHCYFSDIFALHCSSSTDRSILISDIVYVVVIDNLTKSTATYFRA